MFSARDWTDYILFFDNIIIKYTGCTRVVRGLYEVCWNSLCIVDSAWRYLIVNLNFLAWYQWKVGCEV